MITSFLKEENMNEVREIEPNLFRQYTKYKGGFAIMPQELKGKLSLHLLQINYKIFRILVD